MPKYTKQMLMEAIKDCTSIADVLRKLQLVPAGGNYATIKKHLQLHGIDISHFTGQAHLKGKNRNWGRQPAPIDHIFVKNSTYNRSHLKSRIIKDQLLPQCCAIPDCDLSDTWLNKPLVLHLDHINGDAHDNRMENLRFLCPNCHSQTPTYTGKNVLHEGLEPPTHRS